MSLRPIEAENLTPGRHGFFTRQGGKSTGIYGGLNCGVGSNDDKKTVQDNRQSVANTFGLDKDALVSMYQVHSAKVTTITPETTHERSECDAMVTNSTGLALGILTADCAPILLEDRKNGVIGAAHSGWRGSVNGIAQATVNAMVDLGADTGEIKACVGPCISQRAYEVGADFFEDFIAEDLKYSQYFANGNGEKMQFDLPRFVMDQLRSCGLESVNWTGHCTYSDPDRFFSYRRSCHANEPDYGRLISVITL